MLSDSPCFWAEAEAVAQLALTKAEMPISVSLWMTVIDAGLIPQQ